MEINKTTLSRLRADIDISLDEVGKKHGIKLSIGSISFTTDRFTCRLTGENGQSDPDKAKAQFAKYAAMYGFKADDYGKQFTAYGMDYILVGLSPARPKYPVMCERVTDGTRFKFTVESAKMAVSQDSQK